MKIHKGTVTLWLASPDESTVDPADALALLLVALAKSTARSTSMALYPEAVRDVEEVTVSDFVAMSDADPRLPRGSQEAGREILREAGIEI